jgi:glycosyltransferase involved in cell wall biosynthesis
MKVSLITTVLNEEKTIEDFLNSIINQVKKPNEFIIVDGGSVDKTYEIIKKYSKKYRWIKVFQVRGATIGKGRNYAIEKAKNEVIAVTDAGCIVDKNWLKEITKPFSKNKNVDVVVGIYKPYYTNGFEYFQGLIVVPQPEKIFLNPSRMSSRSIAFKKSVWEKVGGYPDLSTGEDTEFNIKLIKNNCKFAFAKNAVVYWRMRKTWKEFAKQFYKYGVGDRKSGNIWRMKRNLIFVFGFWIYGISLIFSTFVSFKLLISLLGLSLLYFLICGIRLAIKSKKLNGIFYGFFLNLIKRIAYILGVTFER